MKRGLAALLGLPVVVLFLGEAVTMARVSDGVSRFSGEDRVTAEHALAEASDACLDEGGVLWIRALRVEEVQTLPGYAGAFFTPTGEKVRAFRARLKKFTYFGILEGEITIDAPAGQGTITYC